MNTTTTVALITISSLSLVASSATLALALIGGRKLQAEVTDVKTKTNKTVQTLKSALETLEL